MIHELNIKAIAVEVPEGAKKLIVIKNSLRWKMNPAKYFWDQAILPKGNWSILGRPKSILEEDWDNIFEQEENGLYVCYTSGRHFITLEHLGHVSTAFECGLSFLKASNIDPSKVIILIKSNNE